MTMTTGSSNRDAKIADLAHRLWEEEGRPEGRAEQHWLRATLEIDGALNVPNVAPEAKSAPKKAAAAKAAPAKTAKAAVAKPKKK